MQIHEAYLNYFVKYYRVNRVPQITPVIHRVILLNIYKQNEKNKNIVCTTTTVSVCRNRNKLFFIHT